MYRLILYLSVVKVYDKSLCEYGSPNSVAPAQCQFFWLTARYSRSMYRLNEEITPGPSAQIFSLRELCDFTPVWNGNWRLFPRVRSRLLPIFRLDKYYTSLGMKLLRSRSRQLIKCIVDPRGKTRVIKLE